MIYNFTIEGFLAADAETRFTAGGTKVVNLRLLHTSRYQRDGQWVDGSTVALDVKCWRTVGDKAGKYKKGDKVLLEASDDLSARAYKDKGYMQVSARNVSLVKRGKRSGDLVQTGDGEVYPAEEAAALAQPEAEMAF